MVDEAFYNIVLVGPMGAGKTSIGKALARFLGWNFYDSDQVVEERAGVDVLWIYDLEGEAGFQQREQKVIAELMQKQRIILATGGNSVALAANREVLSNNSLVIYLRVSLDDQVMRTGYSKKRPLPHVQAERSNLLQHLYDEYVPFYEQLAHIVYNTGRHNTHNTVCELVALIRERTG